MTHTLCPDKSEHFVHLGHHEGPNDPQADEHEVLCMSELVQAPLVRDLVLDFGELPLDGVDLHAEVLDGVDLHADLVIQGRQLVTE